MEQNKLKLENYCLTIEQAKELQALGVDMSNTSMIILQDKQVVPRNILEIKEFFDFCRYDTPTLTNTEMMEIIPDEIFLNNLVYNSDYYREHDFWYVEYENIESVETMDYITFKNELLRNALFEMIKYLKMNKLM